MMKYKTDVPLKQEQVAMLKLEQGTIIKLETALALPQDKCQPCPTSMPELQEAIVPMKVESATSVVTMKVESAAATFPMKVEPAAELTSVADTKQRLIGYYET